MRDDGETGWSAERLGLGPAYVICRYEGGGCQGTMVSLIQALQDGFYWSEVELQ